MPIYSCPGYFQPDHGQFGCINCDSLGDTYQDLSGETVCVSCPNNTMRYRGALVGAKKSSCECKEGLHSIRSPSLSLALHTQPHKFRRHSVARSWQDTTTRKGKPERFAHMHRPTRLASLSPFEWMRRPDYTPLICCRLARCARWAGIVLGSFVAQHLSKVTTLMPP